MEIQGRLKSIIYSDSKTGYTVGQFDIKGQNPQVVVGLIVDPKEGEFLQLSGDFTNHKKYGRQFSFNSYVPVTPDSEADIMAYLSAGFIPGIGPRLAKRIVNLFGKDTFDIIEHEPERLSEVPGIAQKRTKRISDAFKSQKHIKDISFFLTSHKVPTGFAAKIYKKYGDSSIDVLRANPYQLIEDIAGIGFKIADKIALAIGIQLTSVERINAAVRHAVNEGEKAGNVFLPLPKVVDTASELLDIQDMDLIRCAVEQLNSDRIEREIYKKHGKNITDNRRLLAIERIPDGDDLVYDEILYRIENGLAKRFRMLSLAFKQVILGEDFGIDKAESEMGIRLSDVQKNAVIKACKSKVLVLTGGPGTGKTTIIRVIANIFANQHKKVLLCAPTGRAAKRMQEATGFDASTIHRLLEYSYECGFVRNRQNPLEADLVIVDECSMIDIRLMYSLVKAIPDSCSVVLVGDDNQLPSIGPGNVLKDIIKSNVIEVAILDQIFRQAAESKIVTTAHRINNGRLPGFEKPSAEDDFWFLKRDTPEKVQSTILYLMTRCFTDKTINNCQVLTPMHKGPLGTEVLNDLLQKALNPNPVVIEKGVKRLAIGDKVMQCVNAYDREVFNGDIGFVSEVDTELDEITINFYGRKVVYTFDELDQIQLAYACTIHKSQGCEFPICIIPITTQHHVMLARNLLYTAITRGKERVVLIGSPKAAAIAVKNDRVRRRYTRLAERLVEQPN